MVFVFYVDHFWNIFASYILIFYTIHNTFKAFDADGVHKIYLTFMNTLHITSRFYWTFKSLP